MIRLKVAQTPLELRSLFEARYRVFVEEEGYMTPNSARAIVDLYDPLPTTANFCALVEGEVVGGIRITLDSEAGVPADDFFPFRNHLPDGSRIASCGMMCLTRESRHDRRLIVGLLRMCMYWAILNERTWLYGPVNPDALGLVERVGFSALGAPFEGPGQLPSVPVAMDIEAMAPDYVEFVNRQDVGLWMENFERQLYQPGEPVVTRGDTADDALLIVEGEVLVRSATGPVARLHRGHVYGERALVGPSRRAHDVVAETDADVMLLSRDQFQEQLRSDPIVMMELIQALAQRFEDQVRSLEDGRAAV